MSGKIKYYVIGLYGKPNHEPPLEILHIDEREGNQWNMNGILFTKEHIKEWRNYYFTSRKAAEAAILRDKLLRGLPNETVNNT